MTSATDIIHTLRATASAADAAALLPEQGSSVQLGAVLEALTSVSPLFLTAYLVARLLIHALLVVQFGAGYDEFSGFEREAERQGAAMEDSPTSALWRVSSVRVRGMAAGGGQRRGEYGGEPRRPIVDRSQRLEPALRVCAAAASVGARPSQLLAAAVVRQRAT